MLETLFGTPTLIDMSGNDPVVREAYWYERMFALVPWKNTFFFSGYELSRLDTRISQIRAHILDEMFRGFNEANQPLRQMLSLRICLLNQLPSLRAEGDIQRGNAIERVAKNVSDVCCDVLTSPLDRSSLIPQIWEGVRGSWIAALNEEIRLLSVAGINVQGMRWLITFAEELGNGFPDDARYVALEISKKCSELLYRLRMPASDLSGSDDYSVIQWSHQVQNAVYDRLLPQGSADWQEKLLSIVRLAVEKRGVFFGFEDKVRQRIEALLPTHMITSVELFGALEEYIGDIPGLASDRKTEMERYLCRWAVDNLTKDLASGESVLAWKWFRLLCRKAASGVQLESYNCTADLEVQAASSGLTTNVDERWLSDLDAWYKVFHALSEASERMFLGSVQRSLQAIIAQTETVAGLLELYGVISKKFLSLGAQLFSICNTALEDILGLVGQKIMFIIQQLPDEKSAVLRLTFDMYVTLLEDKRSCFLKAIDLSVYFQEVERVLAKELVEAFQEDPVPSILRYQKFVEVINSLSLSRSKPDSLAALSSSLSAYAVRLLSSEEVPLSTFWKVGKICHSMKTLCEVCGTECELPSKNAVAYADVLKKEHVVPGIDVIDAAFLGGNMPTPETLIDDLPFVSAQKKMLREAWDKPYMLSSSGSLGASRFGSAFRGLFHTTSSLY